LLEKLWKNQNNAGDNSSGRSRWPHGLNYRSAATRLLELRVRVPPGAWKFVSCEFCVMSGRSLRVGLITSPEDPH